MALGARRGRDRLDGAAQQHAPCDVGCVLGVVGSIALSSVVRSFLFEVRATDPELYVLSAAMMLLLTMVASALPASRAAAIDPNAALRTV